MEALFNIREKPFLEVRVGVRWYFGYHHVPPVFFLVPFHVLSLQSSKDLSATEQGKRRVQGAVNRRPNEALASLAGNGICSHQDEYEQTCMTSAKAKPAKDLKG